MYCLAGQQHVDTAQRLYWAWTGAKLTAGICDAACSTRVQALQAKWGATVAGLVAEADSANTWWARSTRACCSMRGIGERSRAFVLEFMADIGGAEYGVGVDAEPAAILRAAQADMGLDITEASELQALVPPATLPSPPGDFPWGTIAQVTGMLGVALGLVAAGAWAVNQRRRRTA